MSQLLSIRELMPEVESLTQTWHPRLARSFRRYVSVKWPRMGRTRTVRLIAEPHWLLVPQWLLQRFGQLGRSDRRFLLDILHGQFCAFLAVKLQDDLFDQHVSDLSLICAANHLLLSAREAFAPHFSEGSVLWPFFDASLRKTMNAIIDWDHAQLHGFGPVSSVKAMTSGGYAVCNLATFAACLRLNKPRLFHALLPCTDEIAFVGQLLDDLEDMQSDFDRGRLNYAARFLLKRPVSNSPDLVHRLARAIIVDGRLSEFLSLLAKHLHRAAGVASSIDLPGLPEYIARHREALGSISTRHHQMRVRFLFGTLK